jgi:hypothetical protein
MADIHNDAPKDKDEPSSTPPSTAPKPLREVEVRHLDGPPSLGKERIHPRRPAPIVPKREDNTSKKSSDEKETD